MDDRPTDIFGLVKENSCSVEEKEEPEEQQEKDEVSNIFEEKGEVEDDNRAYDPGKSRTYAENAAFNVPLALWRGRLRRTYLERLNWIHRIKLDALHRKVMKTLRRFIDEDDMDFHEAAESVVGKRKFLLNRVIEEKLLPDESGDDEEAKEEVEASVG